MYIVLSLQYVYYLIVLYEYTGTVYTFCVINHLYVPFYTPNRTVRVICTIVRTQFEYFKTWTTPDSIHSRHTL